MRSLDMFCPSGYRKKSDQPLRIISSYKPEGKALSPFVLSLRAEKEISPITQNKARFPSEDETLQSIESLFRGDHENIGTEYISHQNTQHAPVKKTSHQSLQSQLDAVKKAKQEYKALFEKPSRKKSGFFSLWGK